METDSILSEEPDLKKINPTRVNPQCMADVVMSTVRVDIFPSNCNLSNLLLIHIDCKTSFQFIEKHFFFFNYVQQMY